MTLPPIHHVWFDFSETIARPKKERHNRLRYETYAEVVGRPVSAELAAEYERAYQQNERSSAAVFRALGKPAHFWSERVNALDPRELFELIDADAPNVIRAISKRVPVSLFSNVTLDAILPELGISIAWFTHILNAQMLSEPKPALEGYHRMAELSGIAPREILYIGDDVGKDVRPAKSVGIRTGLLWKRSREADYCFKNFRSILEIVR